MLVMGCACFLVSSMVYSQVTLPRSSAQQEVTQTVGISTITVTYSRPSVISPQGQDRTGNIWGALVPYGFNNLGFGTATAAPWRAGANENTVITLSHDAMVEGKELKGGSYGFHIALQEDGTATVIFSHKTGSWGSFFYDESEDALRVQVDTEEIPQTNLLTYNFPEVSTSEATLALDWEKKRIPVKFSFDTPEIVYQNMKSELENTPGFTLNSWTAAASYLANNKIHLDKALEWANAAIEGQFFSQKNFQTLQTKANVLVAMGKTEEANAVMQEALNQPTASINNYYTYGRQLIAQGKDKEALEIFKKASKKWPDHWLAPHGLARGYAANGEIAKALKFEKTAYEKAPEGSKPFLEGYLKTLEEGKDFN